MTEYQAIFKSFQVIEKRLYLGYSPEFKRLEAESNHSVTRPK